MLQLDTMKNIKVCFAVITLMSLSFSCSEDTLTEIDTNPNIVNDAPLNALLPQLIISYSNEVVGSQGAVQAGFMSEQVSGVLGFNSYVDLESDAAIAWENGFLMLSDLMFMKEKSVEAQSWTYAGISDVITAFTLTTLIDLYGDIPYSEALQFEIRNPDFEAHEAIYPQIQEILNAAIENLRKTDSNVPGSDDLVFNGDREMWVKTAYGLKARLFNKLSKLDPAGSAQLAIDALSNSFAAPEESFSINIYNPAVENGNPYAIRQITQPQVAVGNVFDVMLSFTPNSVVEEDPRSVTWFSTVEGERLPAPSGTAVADFGEPRLEGAVYSKPLFLKFFDAPLPILTYAEVLFIEAEANLRLGNTEAAYNAYQQAVRIGLEQASDFSAEAEISPADVDQYLGYASVSPGAAALTLETLISQKYIYFFKMQWIEAYNETRKFDFFPATNPLGRATRMVYPISEVTRNPNTPADINFSTIFSSNTKLVWAN